MNGKTYKIRRRLSIVALAASIAAIAIPAASAGGKYFGPGSNRVEKQGPYGGYWVQRIRVLGPGLNTVEKRGPYGAYWVRKKAQSKNTLVDSSSVVDRLLGSPDPRDSMAALSKNNDVSLAPGINDPSMCQYHLDPCGRSIGSLSKPESNIGRELFPRADDLLFREILQSAGLEHGAAGFGNLTLNSLQILSEQNVLQSAALEHGAGGFGNATQASWTPVFVDYSHLPGEDRP